MTKSKLLRMDNVAIIVEDLKAVTDIDDVVTRLQKLGAELIGEVVQYEDKYRLCYLRGPEGIMIALAEQLSPKAYDQ